MAPRRSLRTVDVLRKQTKTTAEDDRVLVEESTVRSVGTVTVEERTATPPKIVKVVPVKDSKKKKAREEKANENAVEHITTQEAAAATPTAAPAAKEQKDANMSREATEAAAPKEAEQKGTTKIEKENEGKGIRKRKRRRASGGGGGGYRRYVFRVLKQVHPEMGVSSKAMAVLNGFMDDMFERIVSEAAQMSKYSRRMTLSAKEIQGAVRLVLPGDLGNHAVAEGTKAVSSYYSTVKASF